MTFPSRLTGNWLGAVLICASALNSCAPRLSRPYPLLKPGPVWIWRHGESPKDVADLVAALRALGPDVSAAEAEAAARVLLSETQRFRREFRIVRPPNVHNFLVNMGLRESGLCWQWTEALGQALRPLKLKTLDIHWAVAKPASGREHNVVVLCAAGRPFSSGVVLDSWRASGYLLWIPVGQDSYHWAPRDRDF